MKNYELIEAMQIGEFHIKRYTIPQGMTFMKLPTLLRSDFRPLGMDICEDTDRDKKSFGSGSYDFDQYIENYPSLKDGIEMLSGTTYKGSFIELSANDDQLTIMSKDPEVLPEDIIAIKGDELIERLLEQPYQIIDILPERVEKDSDGQYFEIDSYYHQKEQLRKIREKFVNVLLKLNCYYDLKMSSDGETWILNASPGDLARRFEESAASHSPLSILIGSDDALVTFSGDDHYMTIYNPDEDLLELVRQCAQAEGLFVWGPKQP